jgi:hypothetical protein
LTINSSIFLKTETFYMVDISSDFNRVF